MIHKKRTVSFIYECSFNLAATIGSDFMQMRHNNRYGSLVDNGDKLARRVDKQEII